MPFNVAEGEHPRVSEIFQLGPNTIQVVVDHQIIRITAAQVVRGVNAAYNAIYDIQEEMETPTGNRSVWRSGADLPWAVGDTVEDCLNSALVHIAHRGGRG